MAYVLTSDVIQYGDFDTDFTSDNPDYDWLAGLISKATAIIETYTGRVFEAASATRHFDAAKDVIGVTLLLDDDLAVIDSDTVITNGDATTLNTTDYVTEPRNDTPYDALVLKGSTSKTWEEDSSGDAENAISILGMWGYSVTPPEDIKHATIKLVRLLYKQRSGELDSVSPIVTPQGLLVMPPGFPRDILIILDRYKEVRMAF